MEVETVKGIARLTVGRPPANAWDAEHLAELVRIVDALALRPDIRCLILTGGGSKFFSGGADLHQFDHADPSRAQIAVDGFASAFDRLAAFPGLTIAAVNGYALGGGLEIALACDLRIAEKHAAFGLPEPRVGLLPGGGGTQRLPRLVGPGWAKRIILLGEQVEAVTALGIGLVEQVVETGRAVEAATEWARRASLVSPEALLACKRLIAEAMEGTLADGLVRERTAFARLFETPNQREGVRAFLEKREPIWSA